MSAYKAFLPTKIILLSVKLQLSYFEFKTSSTKYKSWKILQTFITASILSLPR